MVDAPPRTPASNSHARATSGPGRVVTGVSGWPLGWLRWPWATEQRSVEGLADLNSPLERVVLAAPAIRARRLGRALAATVAPISILAALLGLVSVAMPVEDRSPLYIAMLVLAAVGGIVVGFVDCSLGRSVRDLLQTASQLRQSAAERAAELARLNAELRRRDQQRDELLDLLSHELRTPLNAIIGYSGALLDGLDGSLNEEQRTDARLIQQAGKGLLRIVNGTLELFKLEDGTASVTLAPVDARLVVDGAVLLVEPRATANGLSLGVDVPFDLPHILADERHLRRALFDLLENAVKFTPAGWVRVTGTEQEGRITLAVSDSGPGIPKSSQGRIFEPFRQLDASMTRQHGGAGLGLAIARRLVELMDGKLWVESDEGAGATFFLSLPAAPRAGVRAEQEHGPTALPDLLIAGSGAPAERIAGALRQPDTCVSLMASHAASQPREAETAPVVLIDLMQPAAGGWCSLTRLYAEPPRHEAPVVLAALQEQTGHLLTAGPMDVLPASAIETELGSRMVRLLSRTSGLSQPIRSRIVVLGSDPAFRNAVPLALQGRGFGIIEAARGASAVNAALDGTVDGLVMDLLATEPRILDVLSELRADARTAGLPVMLVVPTGLSPADLWRMHLHVSRWLEAGARPIDEITGRVRQILDAHRIVQLVNADTLGKEGAWRESSS